MNDILDYNHVIMLPTFKERFEVLAKQQRIGEQTFGSKRWLNQRFYNSYEWKDIRSYVIARDNGCELADSTKPIPEGIQIVVHHIRPITEEDFANRSSNLLDPNNLITVSEPLHKILHYGGNLDLFLKDAMCERTFNDTCPWKQNTYT